MTISVTKVPPTAIPATAPLDKALSSGPGLGDDDGFGIESAEVDAVERVVEVGVTRAEDVEDDGSVMLK